MGNTHPVETKTTILSKISIKKVEGDGSIVLERKIEKQTSEASTPMPGMDMGGKQAPGVIGGEGVSRIREAMLVDRLKVRRIGLDLMIEGLLWPQE